ncbi:sn-glycerol-3-phosphate import ATP-binding protein UgpC [Thermogemmatispora aurantia]|jgi:ABC-type sugar transport system ATPase subunit|uniref:ABC transporter ATP-binding protein n=1 Tax=Thermogemmatispora aurantia TaxID=2045279 RepID=UPI00124BF274|nr:ABC transporter ATP-binding protein [Thermogemmatispora aurantia]GER84266.1 sn-glycerol-3-phosphate import ATP-binding protein UgpC [Thermogemmatispora aurantia]
MTSLRLEHIVKDYDGPGGRQPALRDISLEVGDGEALAIVGPSGCGKSTLLKVVAGLEFPTHGRIYYGDLDMTDIKPQDRGVGMVFQDYALYPAMKSKGNLAYYFEHHAYTHEQMEERVRRTAELMGVDFQHLLGRFPETLSGGEQQRVAIARCIVRDPTIFLMDEPIVNLDAKRREQTRIEIKKLLRTFHVTTLYVTHDQQEAIFMGDRLAVMRAGRIEQVGSFDDLYYTPVNLFVATFIGSPPLTVLPAALSEGRLHIAGQSWPLPEELAGHLPSGPLRLGVRAEHWLRDQPDGLPLEISHSERIPTERIALVHGHWLGQRVIVSLPLEEADDSRGLQRLRPDWEQLLYFAADDEHLLYSPGPPALF